MNLDEQIAELTKGMHKMLDTALVADLKGVCQWMMCPLWDDIKKEKYKFGRVQITLDTGEEVEWVAIRPDLLERILESVKDEK